MADAFLFPAVGASIKGKTSVNTPRWTGNLATDYSSPLTANGLDLVLHADVSYIGKRYVDIANIAYVGAAARVNVKVGVAAESWEASLFARDLFDNGTALGGGLSGSAACFFTVGARCQFLAVPRGRFLGLETILRF